MSAIKARGCTLFKMCKPEPTCLSFSTPEILLKETKRTFEEVKQELRALQF